MLDGFASEGVAYGPVAHPTYYPYGSLMNGFCTKNAGPATVTAGPVTPSSTAVTTTSPVSTKSSQQASVASSSAVIVTSSAALSSSTSTASSSQTNTVRGYLSYDLCPIRTQICLPLAAKCEDLNYLHSFNRLRKTHHPGPSRSAYSICFSKLEAPF
jgi:hypothetical protein